MNTPWLLQPSNPGLETSSCSELLKYDKTQDSNNLRHL